VVAVVTGAAGFIGMTLLTTLAPMGPVVAIDRRPFDPVTNGVRRIQADLLDHEPEVTAALERASIVYHLAGCPDVRDPRPDVERHRYRDNVLATAAVLARVPPEVPLLVTSSSSVYGGTTRGRPSAETDQLRPHGGYARSKLLVERLCEARLEAGGQVTVVRPFTVAGEGQRPGMGLAQWIDAARTGRPLRLLGHPERSRDITDVRDAARALVALGERRVTGVVNLGTGIAWTLRELAGAVAAAFGIEVATVLEPAHPAEVDHTLADTVRLRRSIGWVPRTDINALVARQAAAAEATAARTATSGQGRAQQQAAATAVLRP
jgi:nucleoside-diphosphate-sugar epimerase